MIFSSLAFHHLVFGVLLIGVSGHLVSHQKVRCGKFLCTSYVVYRFRLVHCTSHQEEGMLGFFGPWKLCTFFTWCAAAVKKHINFMYMPCMYREPGCCTCLYLCFSGSHLNINSNLLLTCYYLVVGDSLLAVALTQ